MVRLLFHPFTLILATLMVILLIFLLRQTINKTRISPEQKTVLQQEVFKMTREISQLEAEKRLAQHPYTQEKILRNELLLQKPGEYILQVPPVSPLPLPSPVPSPSVTPWQEWQQKLLQ